MNNHRTRIAAVLVMLAASGCSNHGQRESSSSSAPAPASATGVAPQTQGGTSADIEAIDAALEDRLRNDRSINMTVMDMSVDSVSVHGDQAQANAVFHLKQGGTGMAMTYFLERYAGGWLVTKSQPSDGDFVHPPMDKTHSGAARSRGLRVPDLTDILKHHSSTKSD